MNKASIDIATVSRFGTFEHKYWVYEELIDGVWRIKYNGNKVKTEEEVFDDLGSFIQGLLKT